MTSQSPQTVLTSKLGYQQGLNNVSNQHATTGHVTAGGTVCLQELSQGGSRCAWHPSYDVASILQLVRAPSHPASSAGSAKGMDYMRCNLIPGDARHCSVAVTWVQVAHTERGMQLSMCSTPPSCRRFTNMTCSRMMGNTTI